MSKGSGRRPSNLTETEWTNRWDAIFGRDLDKKQATEDIMANVDTNDTSKERVAKTSENVHEEKSA